MNKLLALLLLIPLKLTAGAFVFSGDWRSEYAVYKNLDLGIGNDSPSNTKDYTLTRFRLNPEFIVNDVLSIKSQWIVLAGAGTTNPAIDNNLGLVSGANNADLFINHVWLEWVSSFGVFSTGRKPFDYGLGIMFNSGSNVWDYYHNWVDRVSYELRLGSLSIGLAYDMYQEKEIKNSRNEENGFLTKVIYEKIDTGLEVGFMWYMKKDMPGERVNSYDFYQKKNFKEINLDFNWEIVYQKGKTRAYENIEALGFGIEFLYYPNKFDLGLKTGLASGQNPNSQNTNNGFNFNRNYKVALLMFNEDLGEGASTIHGSNGIGADFSNLGAFYIAPSLSYDITSNLKLQTVYIYAEIQKRADNKTKAIGSEVDFNLTYDIYDNFQTMLRTGFFFPSQNFENRKTAFGIMTGLGLSF